MISGCETEIIMYTNDRGFKDRYIYFAFINSVTKDIVKYGEIQLCEQEEDLSCLKGLWKGRIAARESVAFIFSDPMK